jgi:SAM-dependent methyltransferase
MTSVENLAGDEWRGRVGVSWAAEWVRTDRSFAELTGKLIDAVQSGLQTNGDSRRRRILDIGCGAGETALRLAHARPDLDIVGLDLSDELIAAARDRGGAPSNLSFVVGDAAIWAGETPFDAAVSRHGVMFFDDPVAAFGHLHGLMKPGAPLAFTCFAPRGDNPWATEIAALIGAPSPLDLHAPGPFAFAETDRVEGILQSAGWRDAAPERIDYRYVAGGGADPIGDAYDFFMRIGPAARHIATLGAAARQKLEPRLTSWLAAHVEEGEVRFPASAWLWRATA